MILVIIPFIIARFIITKVEMSKLFIWIKGHSDDLNNDMADKLANQGAMESNRMIQFILDWCEDVGGPGLTGRILSRTFLNMGFSHPIIAQSY